MKKEIKSRKEKKIRKIEGERKKKKKKKEKEKGEKKKNNYFRNHRVVKGLGDHFDTHAWF